MAINFDTSYADVDKVLNMCLSILKEEIVKELSYLGEEAVVKVRDRSGDESWYDQTGNLRSSIGYAVYDHGFRLFESMFATVRSGTLGSSEGKRYVESLATNYSKLIALVVVAGMNYAERVEAMKNKDVLASSELWAMSVVDTRIKNAMARAERRINSISI